MKHELRVRANVNGNATDGVRYVMRTFLRPEEHYQIYERAAKKLGKGKEELIVEYEGLTREKGSRHGYGRLVVHESHECDDLTSSDFFNSEGLALTAGNMGKIKEEMKGVDVMSSGSKKSNDSWVWDEVLRKWQHKSGPSAISVPDNMHVSML